MSGQEQLKLKKGKQSGGGRDDTGNDDLQNKLPDIGRIMKEIKRVRNIRTTECSDNPGYCEWSGICGFNDCPRRM